MKKILILALIIFTAGVFSVWNGPKDAEALGDNQPVDQIYSLIGDLVVTMDANLEDIEDELVTSATALTALELDANTLNTLLTALELDSNTLNTAVAALDTTLDLIELDANTLNTNVAAIGTDLDELQLDANTLNATLDAIELDANTLNTNVAAIGTDLDELQLDANTIITSLGTIATEAGTIDTALTAIELDANTIINSIDALGTDLDAIELDANTIITALNNIATEAGTIDTALTALELDANTLNTHAATIATAQTAMELDANTLNTQIALLVTATNNVADYAVNQANECWFLGTAGNDIVCEGAADEYETTLDFRDPTQDNTIEVPDEGGVLVISGKLDIGHHLVTSATPIAGSTLVYHMLDTGGMVEVICGGTSSGTTDAHILTILGGATIIQTFTADTADDGDWYATATFGTSDGASVKSVGLMLFETVDTAGTTLAVEYSVTDLDTSEVTTWTVNIVTATNDDFSLEYCIWKILY